MLMNILYFAVLLFVPVNAAAGAVGICDYLVQVIPKFKDNMDSGKSLCEAQQMTYDFFTDNSPDDVTMCQLQIAMRIEVTEVLFDRINEPECDIDSSGIEGLLTPESRTMVEKIRDALNGLTPDEQKCEDFTPRRMWKRVYEHLKTSGTSSKIPCDIMKSEPINGELAFVDCLQEKNADKAKEFSDILQYYVNDIKARNEYFKLYSMCD
ncbi:unnamed protein product [Owenia fusiformis]|uniref:Uncharacterized protein n=1 Tax=Owenia fusiformis TaxID=6347 RepID=A0A8J1TYL4_OWEFU|nr:unnamed protein product [Owenia fusiformis]